MIVEDGHLSGHPNDPARVFTAGEGGPLEAAAHFFGSAARAGQYVRDVEREGKFGTTMHVHGWFKRV